MVTGAKDFFIKKMQEHIQQK